MFSIISSVNKPHSIELRRDQSVAERGFLPPRRSAVLRVSMEKTIVRSNTSIVRFSVGPNDLSRTRHVV